MSWSHLNGNKVSFFPCTLGVTQKVNQHSENSKFLEACKGLSLSPLFEITLNTGGYESVSN